MWLINSIVRFIQDGGPFMYPILMVGALGTAIVIERFIKLWAVRMANEAMWKRLHPVLVEGDFEKAREMTEIGRAHV